MSEDAEESEEPVDDEELEALAEEDPAAAVEQAAGISGTHLRATEFWDDVIADMEATAAEYEADGWDTLELHPGDVTVLAPDQETDQFGLDVLVPDDEFAAVETLLEDGAEFDAYEAFRAAADGLVLLVVAMEDRDRETAVLYPAYYDVEDSRAMLGAADAAGEMRTYVRTLTRDQVEFTHDDPGNFAPPVGEGGAGTEEAEDAR